MYDLRRVRFHGLIERIPKTHRYRITAKGLRTALLYTPARPRSLDRSASLPDYVGSGKKAPQHCCGFTSTSRHPGVEIHVHARTAACL